MKTDNINKNILNTLVENSKLSCREIGQRTGVSAVTVMKRIKELEKENIIENYSTKLNYEELGLDLTIIINIRVFHGKALEVSKKLSMHPNVSSVYNTTGEFDIMVIGKFKNRKSLDSFLKKIQEYENIERTDTSIVLNISKEENIKL